MRPAGLWKYDALTLRNYMKLQKGDKLVMTGDSITDAHRIPDGEGPGDARGRGYVNMVNALLTSVYPQLDIHVINMGTSGNTVRELKGRWTRDVLDRKPDWVSICIGINDVWRHFDHRKQPSLHVSLEEYRSTLEELVASTLPSVKGMVLMTPYFIEPNRQEPMRAKMDMYAQAVKDVAAKSGVLVVDLQEKFDRMAQHVYNCEIAADRVHPNPCGHMLIAKAFLDAVGFQW
jgi:lysophospholipase L1-like esterase